MEIKGREAYEFYKISNMEDVSVFLNRKNNLC